MGIRWPAVAGGFLLASYIKGTTGMGFPLVATPMVAMLVDVRTAYALLLMPNILMDVFQIGRAGLPWPLWRRLAPLLGTTVIGVFLGTRIMIAIPERAILLALAGMILVFLASTRMRVELRVPPEWESWLGPLTGLVGGVLNGVTNVFSPIGAIYLLALQFDKRDFVKGIASMLLAAKVSQLVAIARWGLYTPAILQWSAGRSRRSLWGHSGSA
ncbi:MAG: sulfite exporter TauE/SafE family protein [candidate division NC10 bacterium]|nr:sulfite exporter TauE/SafE family protein [candidate division NC10 bacterium]